MTSPIVSCIVHPHRCAHIGDITGVVAHLGPEASYHPTERAPHRRLPIGRVVPQ
ncbi:MAG: hypothetical protein QGI86_23295 [Candidatus Poribacteria bacterium]|nr:hypothetical protein [Candidatus Poribacteria bacterium]MDP6751663.1 hypothetical protein [Candidatus Poribacteria bacterium]MDP6995429.1 hypothetical protein [Candidatus Poribacteria bacterium]